MATNGDLSLPVAKILEQVERFSNWRNSHQKNPAKPHNEIILLSALVANQLAPSDEKRWEPHETKVICDLLYEVHTKPDMPALRGRGRNKLCVYVRPRQQNEHQDGYEDRVREAKNGHLRQLKKSLKESLLKYYTTDGAGDRVQIDLDLQNAGTFLLHFRYRSSCDLFIGRRESRPLTESEKREVKVEDLLEELDQLNAIALGYIAKDLRHKARATCTVISSHIRAIQYLDSEIEGLSEKQICHPIYLDAWIVMAKYSIMRGELIEAYEWVFFVLTICGMGGDQDSLRLANAKECFIEIYIRASMGSPNLSREVRWGKVLLTLEDAANAASVCHSIRLEVLGPNHLDTQRAERFRDLLTEALEIVRARAKEYPAKENALVNGQTPTEGDSRVH